MTGTRSTTDNKQMMDMITAFGEQLQQITTQLNDLSQQQQNLQNQQNQQNNAIPAPAAPLQQQQVAHAAANFALNDRDIRDARRAGTALAKSLSQLLTVTQFAKAFEALRPVGDTLATYASADEARACLTSALSATDGDTARAAVAGLPEDSLNVAGVAKRVWLPLLWKALKLPHAAFSDAPKLNKNVAVSRYIRDLRVFASIAGFPISGVVAQLITVVPASNGYMIAPLRAAQRVDDAALELALDEFLLAYGNEVFKRYIVDCVVEKEESDLKPTSPLFRCFVQINGHAFVAVVDSGAELCVVSSQVVETAQLQTTESQHSMMSFGGMNINANECVETTMLLDGNPYVLNAVVADGGPQVLLGANWLSAAAAQIDFSSSPSLLILNKGQTTIKSLTDDTSTHIFSVKAAPTKTYQYKDAIEMMVAEKLNHLSSKERDDVEKVFRSVEGLVCSSKKAPPVPVSTIRHPVTHEPICHVIRPKPNADFSDARATYRHQTQAKQAVIDVSFERLQVADLIEKPPFNSQICSSHANIVHKKDTSWQFDSPTLDTSIDNSRTTVDFRVVNTKTESDPYPMPNVTEVLDKASRGRLRTVLDAKSFFHSFLLSPESRKYTATNFGKGRIYQWKKAPFGITNIMATAQRAMDEFMVDENIAVFCDDSVRGHEGLEWEQSLRELKEFLEKFASLQIVPTLDKAQILVPQVKLLGHLVSQDQWTPIGDRLQALADWPPPPTKQHMLRFLASANYYRSFIPRFAVLAAELYDTVKKSQSYSLSPSHKQQFHQLQQALIQFVPLHPYDAERAVEIRTDASDRALGYVICQVVDGKERVLVMGGRKLLDYEIHYSIPEKELLAIDLAIEKYPHLTTSTRHPTSVWFTDSKAVAGAMRGDGGKQHKWRRCIQNILAAMSGLRLTVRQLPATDPKMLLPDSISRMFTLREQTPALLDEDDNDLEVIEEVESDEKVMSDEKKRAKEFEESMKSFRVIERALDDDEPLDEDSAGMYLFAVEQRADPDLAPFFEAAACRSAPQWVAQLQPSIDGHGRLFVRVDKQNKLVVPDVRVAELVASAHRGATGGHGKLARTLERLRVGFWWRKMSRDTEAYIRRCVPCQRAAPVRNNAALGAYPLAARLERVHIDWIYLPKDAEGYTYALAIVDAASGTAEVVPTRSRQAWEAIKALEEHWIKRYGPMRLLVSDHAKEFTGLEFEALKRKYNIKLLPTTSYNKKANGIAERFIKTFKSSLLSLIDRSATTEWRPLLSSARWSYMTALSKPRAASPFELLHGMRAHQAFERRNGAHHDQAALPADQLAPAVEQAVSAIVERQREATSAQQREGQERRDASVAQRPLVVTDLVWMEEVDNTSGTAFLKGDKRHGPFRITEIDAKRNRAKLVIWATNAHMTDWVSLHRLRLIAPGTEQPMANVEGDDIAWGGARDLSGLSAKQRKKIKSPKGFENAATSAVGRFVQQQLQQRKQARRKGFKAMFHDAKPAAEAVLAASGDAKSKSSSAASEILSRCADPSVVWGLTSSRHPLALSSSTQLPPLSSSNRPTTQQKRKPKRESRRVPVSLVSQRFDTLSGRRLLLLMQSGDVIEAPLRNHYHWFVEQRKSRRECQSTH